MTKKVFLLLLLSVFIRVSAEDLANPETVLESKKSAKTEALPIGFGVKIMPTLFWNTMLIDVEVPLGQSHFTFGTMLYGAWGINKNQPASESTYQDAGFGVDLYAKYYFNDTKKNTSEGLYALVNISYNSIVYPDGTVRPFSLNANYSTKKNATDAPQTFNPYPVNGGLGIGYQLKIIPKHIYGSVMLGTQFSVDKSGKFLPTIYFLPTIGYVF